MSTAVAEQYGVVLLAAGKSSRLGQPKQFLIFENTSLVKRAAKTALEITDNVIVVTGALNEKIEKELHGLPLNIIHNRDFEEGIASSICVGITALLKTFPKVSGAILIVCDQPYVSAMVLDKLVETSRRTNKGIVASAYAGTLGTPVLFLTKYFEKLLELTGDSGAKMLMGEFSGDVATIDFPLGEVDIDNMQDYQAIVNRREPS